MNALRAAALLLLFPGAACAAGNAVYQRQSDDGTVELTNIPDGTPADYQPIVAPPAAPAAAPADQSGASAAQAPKAKQPMPISQGPMGETLRELYSGAHAAHQAAGK
jgi:hypothetical protein